MAGSRPARQGRVKNLDVPRYPDTDIPHLACHNTYVGRAGELSSVNRRRPDVRHARPRHVPDGGVPQDTAIGVLLIPPMV
jgi:hypothetical protein